MSESTQSLVAEPPSFEGRFKFVPTKIGGLEIWRPPEKGALYVAGIDTSGGGASSDFSSLSMVETRSRALVAAWNGRYDPTLWGQMCARVGLYYNEALLAFETHPSQHGLSACLSARDYGYSNLYRRQQQGMVSLRISEELGWATTYKTKPLIIDRVRIALREKYSIPSQALLQQLLQAKLAENGEVEFDGHDDFFISYGIAQIVCDVVGVQGFLTKGEEKPKTWTDSWWEHRKKAWANAASGTKKGPRLHDGV